MLGATGVLALYSAGGGSVEPYAMSHLVRLLSGLALMLVLAVLPARIWLHAALPIYVLALVALAIVPFAGTAVSGSRRWLDLGLFMVQPAEIMKLAMVLAIAAYYQWLPRHLVSRPLYVALPLILLALPVVLILKQPDLGTALLILASGLGLVYLSGVSSLYAIAGAVALGVLAPVLWSNLHDYQQERILVFLDPERDLLGRGYQVYQARIALAAGGLFGKGFLQGTQSQLSFVPEHHTDFILALIGEEFGFAGAAGLLLLFAALLLALLLYGLRLGGRFQRLVVLGACLSLFLQVSVNAGMVMGLLPVVGVPLPLVSFGGSAMLTMLATLGIALSMCTDGDGEFRPRRPAWQLTRR
jgi:rod shape determining protein RodA